jgi:3'-phosphoadenosine 5'-phosphosulfate sulfotransferase (PAPS reductase)/FAD synthetase
MQHNSRADSLSPISRPSADRRGARYPVPGERGRGDWTRFAAFDIPIPLRCYDAILLDFSGGKDSQAAIAYVTATAEAQHVRPRLAAFLVDTGAEWTETVPHAKLITSALDIPLTILHPTTPLPQYIRKRGRWPSAACRYCTSDCKRDPWEKHIRSLYPQNTTTRLLHVSGIRAEESAHRRAVPEVSINHRLTTLRRTVTEWRPIIAWTLQDVLAYNAQCKLPLHPAYERGASRLSCAICPISSYPDMRLGARYNKDLAEYYLDTERLTGHRFTAHRSLQDILSTQNGL